jgi:hypothetical protein
MIILGNGNVGINSGAPTTKLDVVGTSGTTLKIVDGNQANGKVLTSDANGVASWATAAAGNPAGTANEVQFRNGAAFGAYANFVWDNTNKRLGINNNAPSDTLSINSVSTETNRIYQRSTTGGSVHLLESVGDAAGIDYQIAGAGWTKVADYFVLGSLGASAYDGTAFRAVTNIKFQMDGPVAAGDTPGSIIFETTNAGSSSVTEKMRIANDGKVAIGTSSFNSDAQKLEIVGGGPRSILINSGWGTGAGIGLKATDTGGRTFTILSTGSGNNGGAGKLQFYDYTAGQTRMAIDSSGNVGIQNTSPSAWLHVGDGTLGAGTAVAKFQTATGTCTMTPATSGTGMACSSDERLKKNILEVSGEFALDKISKIQAVNYSFKKDPSEKRYTGYIAQELLKVAPEFVRLDDDGYYQVYYDGLIPWITEAIKTVYHRVLGVEAQQAQLNREIASLKEENAKLKKDDEQKGKELQAIKEYLCLKDPSAPICK